MSTRTGEQIVAIAEKHIGEKYIYGAQVPMDDAGWSGPWDCAEFASWCVYQTIEKLYGCTDNSEHPAKADAWTASWKRDANSIGNKVSVEEASTIPGAFVLRRGNNSGHIAITDGHGGTIEAKGKKWGVVRDKVAGRRWDMGILVPGIEYTAASEPIPISAPEILYRVTSPYMESEKIGEIQQRLHDLGFDPGIIDGIYGPETAAAVYAFQLAKGLVPDGEVGSQTAGALNVEI